MREIYLHGDLRRFGKCHKLDVSSAAEAIRALCVLIKGFRQHVAKGNYEVIWKSKERYYLTEDNLRMSLGDGSVHICPVVVGSGGGGTWKLIAGAVLIATAFILAPEAAIGSGAFLGADWGATAISLGSVGAITFGNIASLGFALMLLGAGQLLAPKPSTPDALSQSPDGGNLFSAPENVSAQGLAVPLAYGRILLGSVVISSGLSNVAVAPGSIGDPRTSPLSASVLSQAACSCPLPGFETWQHIDLNNTPPEFHDVQGGVVLNGYMYMPNVGFSEPVFARMNTTSFVVDWVSLGDSGGPQKQFMTNAWTDGTYIYAGFRNADGTDSTLARLHTDFATIDYLTLTGYEFGGPSAGVSCAGAQFMNVFAVTGGGGSDFHQILKVGSDFATIEVLDLAVDLGVTGTNSANVVTDGSSVYLGVWTVGANDVIFKVDPNNFNPGGTTTLNITAESAGIHGGNVIACDPNYLYFNVFTPGFGHDGKYYRVPLTTFTGPIRVPSVLDPLVNPFLNGGFWDGGKYIWLYTGAYLSRFDVTDSWREENTIAAGFGITNWTGVLQDGLKRFVLTNGDSPFADAAYFQVCS